MKKYFENRNTLKCQECGTVFTMKFLSWLFAMHIIDEYRYTKCPHCKKWNWNKRLKPKPEQVKCIECSYESSCETREMRTGCFMGDKR